MANYKIIGVERFNKGAIKLYTVNPSADQGTLTGKNGAYGSRVGATCAEVMIFASDLEMLNKLGVDVAWFESAIKSGQTIPCKTVFGQNGARCVIDETAMVMQVLNKDKGGGD